MSGDGRYWNGFCVVTPSLPLPGWDENRRQLRNGHTIGLAETDWRCETCGHTFDAAVDAERFACGKDCAGRHPGQDQPDFESATGRMLALIFPMPEDGAS